MLLSVLDHSDLNPSVWAEETFTDHDLRHLPTHSPLFREGDQAAYLYEIIEGVARSFKIFPDGRRQVVAFAFPGDIVGFGHGNNYRFDCDTITKTHIRTVPKSALMRAMLDRPELGERLLAIAADEVSNMRDLSILLCRKTAIERLATFLLHIARRSPINNDDNRHQLPMCRADIADFLGLTIETVSRTLTKLRQWEIIDLPDRSAFVLKDRVQLCLLAECDDRQRV